MISEGLASDKNNTVFRDTGHKKVIVLLMIMPHEEVPSMSPYNFKIKCLLLK